MLTTAAALAALTTDVAAARAETQTVAREVRDLQRGVLAALATMQQQLDVLTSRPVLTQPHAAPREQGRTEVVAAVPDGNPLYAGPQLPQ